ncbi:MAG TPA: histidine phosphatase family protein [Methylophaga sp.]|nr:histidine phosphatase family protein [Methylophaga sp.]
MIDSCELMLLRHGKSSWETMVSDFDRDVTDKGKQHVEEIGIWLKQHQKIPDYVLCSPAKRAQVTAEIVCQQLGISKDDIKFNHQIYNADVSDIFNVVKTCPSHCRRVLLIGHNPSIEMMIHHLASDQNVNDVDTSEPVRPATLVCFSFNEDWNKLLPHSAELISITHGKYLP